MMPSPGSNPISAAKAQLRTRHRTARRGLTPEEIDLAEAGLARHGLGWIKGLPAQRDGLIGAYLGVDVEPPTNALLWQLHGAGYTVMLPVCEQQGLLSWVAWTPSTTFERSQYAPVLEPVGVRRPTSWLRHATGILAPATAVDLSGHRVGQGGGYYDRFFASLDAGALPPTAAVVYAAEILPAGTIATESFDFRLKLALTPDGITSLGPDSRC